MIVFLLKLVLTRKSYQGVSDLYPMKRRASLEIEDDYADKVLL